MRNKRQAAEFLGVSTRTLERNAKEWGLLVTHKPAGRTTEAFYDEEQLQRVKESRDRGVMIATPAAAEAEALALPGGGLAGLPPQILAGVATLLARPLIVSGSERLTLSLAEASEASGLTSESLRLAIKDTRLKARKVKGRRGWTILPADLRAYCDELLR